MYIRQIVLVALALGALMAPYTNPQPQIATTEMVGTAQPNQTLATGEARLIVLRPSNIRSGPGTNHAVIGSAKPGQALPILGRNEAGDWWQVEFGAKTGWIYARLGEANVGIDQVPVAVASPDMPIVTPSPAAEASQPPPTLSPEPVLAGTVLLAADTRYPVQVQRVIGDGYEIVDASSQYDLVIRRDVLGQVAHQFWGDKLFRAHPQGLRITLVDFNAPPECNLVCKSCPGQPVIQRPVTPNQTTNDWRGLCKTHTYQEGYGDGAGSMIWVGCTHYNINQPDDGFAVLTDPAECFITIQSAGAHLTDLLVSATVTAYNFWTVDNAWGATPEFDKTPFTPLLGQAYREGDQWRWRDPYLQVVRAAE